MSKRDTLIKWLETQGDTITRKALEKKVGQIWPNSRASDITYYLLKNNPKIFEDVKVLTGADVKGLTAFREYLAKTPKRDTTTPQLVKDFKKATGKTIEMSEGRIGAVAQEFRKKFNLVLNKPRPPSKVEQKALDVYKKLPDSTKFAFQTGGPGQKGLYAKWLADQGLKGGDRGRKRFITLLKREGLYKKAPVKTSAEKIKAILER